MRFRILLLVLVVAAGGAIAGAKGIEGDPLDPVRNLALPCEAVSTPGLVPRAAKNIAHVANVCGFVGTDIEFQSRRAADGTVHDYAFVTHVPQSHEPRYTVVVPSGTRFPTDRWLLATCRTC